MSHASDPATQYAAVTPHDVNALPMGEARAFFVGTSGNVAVPYGAGSVVFKNVPAGSVLPVRATRVLATGTTAADIIALY